MSAQGHPSGIGKLTYFAKDINKQLRQSGMRLSDRLIGIAQPDRRQPFYIVGQGSGGTDMIARMAGQDIEAGRAVVVIDPLGGRLTDTLLSAVPKARQKDLAYFNAADIEYPVALNVLETAAQNLVQALKDIWHYSWGPNLEYLLSNAVLALAENPGTTILHINKLLVDDRFRARIVQGVQDPVIKAFWQEEFAGYPERLRAERILPVQNKVGAFASQPVLRNILGQTKSTLKFDEVIQEKRIVLINLAKPMLGEAANLLGSLILSSLKQAVMAQAARPESEQSELNLYIDNCHYLVTQAFTTLLSETAAYKLNVVLSHQHLGQLTDEIRASILGNAGTVVCFRLGVEDARILESSFLPHYTWQDLVNLSPSQIIFKLLKNGQIALPEGSSSLPRPRSQRSEEYRRKLIAKSRCRYGRHRSKVERKIRHWLVNGQISKQT